MRRLFWVLWITTACGGHAPPAPTAAAPPRAIADAGMAAGPRAPKAPVPIEEYFNTRRFGPPRFSAGDRWVAYSSDEGGRPDVWVQPRAGGPARQITHVQGFLHSYDFSPTRDQLVYAADVGGDELAHLFLTDSSGAAPRDLTADLPEGRRADFVEWALDGKTFLYVSTARDPRFADLYEYDIQKRKSRLLWQASGILSFAVPSRDHRRFAILEVLSDVETNIWLVERGSKAKPRLLTPHRVPTRFHPMDFSRDGRTLYATSDAGGEFLALTAIDLSSGRTRTVESSPWDVELAAFSPRHRWMVVQTNEDGLLRTRLRDARTHKEVALPAAPGTGAWDVPSFSWSERYLGAVARGDATPGAPYVIDLKTGQARALAEPLPPALRGRPLAAARSVRIPSFDGKEIPAFLYSPQQALPVTPGMVLVHGGPTAQSLRRFSPLVQYMASKGYAVLVPNVRGSTGYGKSWTDLDNKDFGGGPLKDVVACKAWAIQNAGVAADKTAVVGGSYGGYMVLAAATFTPTEFSAHVDYFGVSELKSLVEEFPAYWEAYKAFTYAKFGNPNDPKDVQYMHDRSPLYFVDRIQRPLLVVQGDRDVRVKKDQSDRIVEALKARNVPVHYLILKNEGHGFSRNESQLAAFGATDRFLDRYLFGDTTAEVVR